MLFPFFLVFTLYALTLGVFVGSEGFWRGTVPFLLFMLLFAYLIDKGESNH